MGKKSHDITGVRGRSRESSSSSNRRSCPHPEQKSCYSGRDCGKKIEHEETSDSYRKKSTACERPKSIDSISKSEKTELLNSAKIVQTDSLTISEKEEGSPGATKLKRSESFTKADKEEATALNTNLKRSESLTKAERVSESNFTNTKLKRSESLIKAGKAEKSETASNIRLRRSKSLTKDERSESPSNSKLERSDSLTKTEKTESNIRKRRKQ